MRVHFFSSRAMYAAVARQNPGESIIEEFGHRLSLFRPGIPADIAKSTKRLAFWRPSKVISGEKNIIAVQQHLMPARVPWRGNGDQVVVDTHGFLPGQNL